MSFASKKRRRSCYDDNFVHRPSDKKGNYQEHLEREDDQAIPVIDDINDGINNNSVDDESSESHAINLLGDEISSESSDEDLPKPSAAIDYNSFVDEDIDVFRMSRKLWKITRRSNIRKKEMQSRTLSMSKAKTAYEVSKRLFDWKGSNKVSDEALKELFETLNWAGIEGIPRADHLLQQGIGCIPEIPGLGNIDSFLCFQQCPKSCMVYHGENSMNLQCSTCESPRFAACTKCSPRECTCSLNRRIPLKSFYYSSLIYFLRDKLSQPTASNFVMALNAEVVKVNDTHINDISDGVSVKKAIEDMVSTFKAYCSNKSQNLIMVNLVLGGYYDGAQMFKSKVESFWPAGISILNLPPSYRFKEGVGFHLWALFMGKTPSAAEDYLFGSCLGEELKVLKHGIIIANKYFVQARFVISVMDTKAHMHFTRFQSAGSCSPCPCCGFRGSYVGKVVYTDHRKYLGWTHAYRAIGQSRKCCPEHQYSTAPQNSTNKAERAQFWTNIEYMHPEEGDIEAHEKRYKSKIISTTGTKKANDERKILAKSVCNKEQGGDINAIYSDVMAEGHDFLFYHDYKKPGSDKPMFCYTDFIDRMYFVSCYYKDYERDRRTSEDELRARMKETDEAISEINMTRQSNGRKPLRKIPNPENGCHGSFALVDAPVTIQSFQIWDPFHALPNVTNRLLELLSGKYFSKATIEICNRVGMHESVGEKDKKKTNHPWEITHDNMNLIDGLINCCLIATGFGDEFQLRYLFKQGGLLKSASKIQLLRIMAPVLAAFSGLDEAYQQFIRMLHHDIVYLFRPFFERPEDIDKLFLLLVETVVTAEGLFPISEHFHGFHQLVCLVKQLKEFGPITNLLGAIMERAIKSIKDAKPNGGQSPFRTQLRRYAALMKQRHGQAFRFKSRRMKIYSSSHIRRVRKLHKDINDPGLVSITRVDGNSPSRIQYNDAKICLWKEATARRCEKVIMDNEDIEIFFEQSLFIEALLHEIKKQGEEANSPLYKAYSYFKANLIISACKTWKALATDLTIDDDRRTRRTKFNKAFVCWIYFVATGHMRTKDKDVIPDPLGLEQIFTKMNVADFKLTFISIHGLFTNEVKYYRNANAYGIRINSRLESLDANFADCPESGQRIFDESKIASSFCKYHDQKDVPKYGMCQYFFRVICPSDQVIHGMPLARVLQINTFTNDAIEENPKLSVKKGICRNKVKFGLTGILVENDEDHQGLHLFPDDCCQFVPLSRFFSTSVILIPLDVKYKPMLHKIKRRSYAMSEHLKDQSVISTTNKIGMFYVIDFHPERSIYVYSKTNNAEYNDIQNDH